MKYQHKHNKANNKETSFPNPDKTHFTYTIENSTYVEAIHLVANLYFLMYEKRPSLTNMLFADGLSKIKPIEDINFFLKQEITNQSYSYKCYDLYML